MLWVDMGGLSRPKGRVGHPDLTQKTGQNPARCLADDLDALVAHLRYPTRHRRRGPRIVRFAMTT
jgi:hypothetical protein